jgi:NADPH-dependent curcumin reductase CurA
MSKLNHKFELAERPVGIPKRTDWAYMEESVAPGEGELLIKILYISLDLAMRGWMNEGKSYIALVEISEVMRVVGWGT